MINAADGYFQPILRQNTGEKDNFVAIREIVWRTGRHPTDRPICGFSGFDGPCQPMSKITVQLTSIVLARSLMEQYNGNVVKKHVTFIRLSLDTQTRIAWATCTVAGVLVVVMTAAVFFVR